MEKLLSRVLKSIGLILIFIIICVSCTKGPNDQSSLNTFMSKTHKTAITDTVIFYSFIVYSEHDGMLIVWETDLEENVIGFHVWRADSDDLSFVRLTTDSIPSGTGNYSYTDRNVINQETYCYALEIIYYNRNVLLNENKVCATADLYEINPVVPDETGLYGNYPNPFSDHTTIRFALSQSGYVQLNVYTTSRKHITELVNGLYDAGYHVARFDGSTLDEGLYVYELQAGDFKNVNTMLIMRD